MAMNLKTDYKDYYSIGEKQYKITQLTTGYVNITDTTAYDIVGDDIQASDINTITSAINSLSSSLDSTNDHVDYLQKVIEQSGKIRVAAKVTLIGDGKTKAWRIAHELNSKDVSVNIFAISTGEEWLVDIARDSADTVTIEFANAPDKGAQFRVLIDLISSTELDDTAITAL